MIAADLQEAAASAAEVAPVLAQAGLPTDDLAWPGRRFFAFGDERGSIVGVAGLEIHGEDALLRSVAVIPSCRGQGVGRDIVGRALAQAAMLGARRVFLLTSTAPAFFTALGFAAIARGTVPAAIAATHEFTTLCPASAVCMVKTPTMRS